MRKPEVLRKLLESIICMNILWATPSAAGPRSLLIAAGLQFLGIVASVSWYFWDERVLVFLGRKLVIWHDWWLHFGVLGVPWADFGTLGSITTDTLRSRPGFLQSYGGFWCPWLSFGMLGASTLPSWGTLGRSWDDPRT